MADLTGTTPADTYKGLLQVNDYTNGIAGNTGSSALVIQDGAGNATALAISTDNVGIGTTSPAYKLEVQEATNSTYAAKIFNNGGDSYGLLVKTSSGTDEDYPILDLENTSSNVFRVQANGNVGIGTASPSAPLHIVGTPSSTLILERDSADISAISSVIFKDGSDDQVRISSTDSKFLFETGAASTPRMLIEADGNVGIGTTSPSAPLEVSSTTGGMIMPRMTTTQRNAIASPTNGEMVYDTDLNKFYGYANNAWTALH